MEFAPGAWRAALIPLVVSVPAGIFAPWLAVLLIGAAVAVLAFHRDPERPIGEGVVSPAEGTVSVVRNETGDAGRERVRVGVYMSARDVHVNRAPLAGRVAELEREPGGNKPAFSKESDRNERVRIQVEAGEHGYELVLIAGWFARRVHPYVSRGDRIERGDRVGHISFGSRVDVVCPPAVDQDDLVVEEGDAVRAAETLAAL